MKITIGIPCYNGAEWICDAIDSALNQTIGFDQKEIIVVDDGSTDGSLKIMKRYEGMGVKVIHQVNKGLSATRNTVIMNMTGNYLLPLDADDILLENCLEEILKEINQTGSDIIGLSFKEFGVSHREVILDNPTLDDFKIANRIGYCSAVKKEALLECGGYSSRMIWGAEDYALWFDLLSRGKKLVTIKNPLWLYRVKENSMWTETVKYQKEYMNQIIKDFPEVFNE